MPDEPSAASADLRLGVRVSTLSIAWTVVASTLSIAIGVTSSNLVLVAFGCTGLLDAAGSVALVVHFRHALKHETFSERHEHIAFLIVTGGLVVVALATAAESLSRLLTKTHGGQSIAGIGVAGASIVVLAVLAQRKIALGRSIPSQALVADGLLSTTGAVLAVVTVLGTLLGALGWWWADPIAALGVAVGALAVAVILARQ
ncbi:MAG: cation transporter [Candidatus Nanopelagicales bacterium]